jgi:murein DD-endopeptidase MepM/ murein hydrolase activator NlpD
MGPRLDGLEAVLRDRSVASDLQPSGRPLERGWVSSFFGNRTDPITGRAVFHEGVDFVAKAGAEVVAAASGIVTWAGQRRGYGNLIEISHGDGYTTRYAHNERHLVQAGTKVDKGQPIALLGATGRSTGPHLHFEVLRNGKALNPMRFVKEGQ